MISVVSKNSWDHETQFVHTLFLFFLSVAVSESMQDVRGGIIGGVVGSIGLLLVITIIAVLIILALNACKKKKQVNLSGIFTSCIWSLRKSQIPLAMRKLVCAGVESFHMDNGQ